MKHALFRLFVIMLLICGFLVFSTAPAAATELVEESSNPLKEAYQMLQRYT